MSKASIGKGYWYVRHQGRVSGPFSKGLIQRQVLLGRIAKDDEFSQDQKNWKRLSQLRDLVPEVMITDLSDPLAKQRLAAARRWADDREDELQPVSRDATTQPLDQDDDTPLEHARLSFGIRERLAKKRRERLKNGLFTVLIITLFVLVIGSYLMMNSPVIEPPVDCMAPPEPGVVWDNCVMPSVVLRGTNLQGARLMNVNLAGADLSNANMSEAELSYAFMVLVNAEAVNWSSSRMVGVNLRGANLSRANFNGADLSYANLLGANIDGANFSGASLGKVRWIDGRVCAVGSVTHCQ